jgi:hypothetical protein
MDAALRKRAQPVVPDTSTMTDAEAEAAAVARISAYVEAAMEAARADMQDRIGSILESTAEGGRACALLDEERQSKALEDGLYLLSVCDGAKERDDCGYNKPDAGRARRLIQAAGDPTLRASALTALYWVTRKYAAQLARSVHSADT